MSIHLRLASLLFPCVVGAGAVLSAAGAGSPSATILFSTKLPGVVDAHVERVVGGSPAAEWVSVDRRFVGQLQLVGPGGSTTALGEPVPFEDAVPDALGCITGGGTVVVPGVSPGDPVQIRMVAWLRAYGGTYEEAARLNLGLTGAGGEMAIRTGGGALVPGLLTGMKGFRLQPGVGAEIGKSPTPLVRWVANGHSYQALEAPGLTWAQARAAAESHSLQGVGGHLVTPASWEENAFLAAHPKLGANAGRLLGNWIGGYHPAGEPDVMKGWRWVTGEPFNDVSWYLDTPAAPGTADYSAYFRVALRGPTGMDWGFVADSLGATQPGYVIEYDTAPDPVSGGSPGPLEFQPVVVGLTGVKALLYWPPEAGVSLQRSSPKTPGVWEQVEYTTGKGAFMELPFLRSEALFRLERAP